MGHLPASPGPAYRWRRLGLVWKLYKGRRCIGKKWRRCYYPFTVEAVNLFFPMYRLAGLGFGKVRAYQAFVWPSS